MVIGAPNDFRQFRERVIIVGQPDGPVDIIGHPGVGGNISILAIGRAGRTAIVQGLVTQFLKGVLEIEVLKPSFVQTNQSGYISRPPIAAAPMPMQTGGFLRRPWHAARQNHCSRIVTGKPRIMRPGRRPINCRIEIGAVPRRSALHHHAVHNGAPNRLGLLPDGVEVHAGNLLRQILRSGRQPLGRSADFNHDLLPRLGRESNVGTDWGSTRRGGVGGDPILPGAPRDKVPAKDRVEIKCLPAALLKPLDGVLVNEGHPRVVCLRPAVCQVNEHIGLPGSGESVAMKTAIFRSRKFHFDAVGG